MFDVVIRGGTVYDGSGAPPLRADVAVRGDSIAAVGDLAHAEAGTVVDASGLAVAPGFVNVLSHSYFTILHDPRSLGELTQGVTTQVFGEGNSMGPLSAEMRALLQSRKGALSYEVEWDRLSEYLAHVEKRGTSQNVASFIGAETIRVHVVGYDDRPPTADELDRMKALVDEEMADGALGIGSALIYPPGAYASTQELVELCKVAALRGGMYISHIRGEGGGLLDAVSELLTVSREAELPAEIFHLKASGRPNWPKMARAIEIVEEARAKGAPITADVYTYTAGSTGLNSCIPARFHDGGPPKLYERLADSGTRAEIRRAIESEHEWDNFYALCGGGKGILILGVRKEENRKHQGRTLAEIAEAEGTDEIEAMMDLLARDRSRIATAYFLMSEDNLRTEIVLPWVSFGSDAGSMAAEGVFLEAPTHPRAYGNFARLLGKYVREEKLIPLEEAVRRLSAFPAETLGLHHRGQLREDWFADIVVFDPATVADRATYEEPHQYAVGVRDVIVNGELALRDGVFTGALAGRALYGRGKRSA